MSPEAAANQVTVDRPPAEAGDQFPDIVGYVDSIGHKRVSGWAWDRQRPEDRLDVEVRLDNRPVATVRADVARADLARLGTMGDGTYGFVIELPEALTRDEVQRVTAVVRHAGLGGPVRLSNQAAANAKKLNLRMSDYLTMVEQLDQCLADQRSGFRYVYNELRTVNAALAGLANMRPGASETAEPSAALEGIREELAKFAVVQNAIERGLVEVSSAQRELARRLGDIDVFQSRVDEALAEIRAARETAAPAGDQRGLRRLVLALAVLTLVSLATGVFSLL